MAFAGIYDELRRHTKRLQGVPEFVGLRSGAFCVVLTDNDEGGGLDVLDEVNGRTFLVNGGIVVNSCAEERDHPLIAQVLAIVTLPICKASTRHGPTETIGLRNCPHGHEPAVTPAGHAETRRIDWIFFYCGIDPGEHVAQIAGAKIFHVSAGEIFSLTVTSTRIRHQNVVTSRRESGDDGSRHSK